MLGAANGPARPRRTTDTTSPAAFASPDTGPVGLVAEGRGTDPDPAGPARAKPPGTNPAAVRTAVLPVVLVSRIGAGPVLTGTYGFPGSESDLLARGLISARALDCYKARVLLHLLLAGDADRQQITTAFDTMGADEVLDEKG